MSASREICKAHVNLRPLPKSFPSQSLATCHHVQGELVMGVTKSERDVVIGRLI